MIYKHLTKFMIKTVFQFSHTSFNEFSSFVLFSFKIAALMRVRYVSSRLSWCASGCIPPKPLHSHQLFLKLSDQHTEHCSTRDGNVETFHTNPAQNHHNCVDIGVIYYYGLEICAERKVQFS